MRLAVIPARWGSSRIPGKAVAELGGVPLVVHVWRRVVGSGLFDRVVVATDDERVAAVCDAVMTGPAVSGTHRVAQIAGDADVVVNVQGDQPLVAADALAAAVRGLERAPIATVAAPYVGDPENRALVKVAVAGGLATTFTRKATANALHHVGIYAFAGEALHRAVAAPRTDRTLAEDLEQLAWMDAGIPIAVEAIAFAPPAIDTIEQLQALQSRFDRGLERVPEHPDPNVYSAAGLRYPAPIGE